MFVSKVELAFGNEGETGSPLALYLNDDTTSHFLILHSDAAYNLSFVANLLGLKGF